MFACDWALKFLNLIWGGGGGREILPSRSQNIKKYRSLNMVLKGLMIACRGNISQSENESPAFRAIFINTYLQCTNKTKNLHNMPFVSCRRTVQSIGHAKWSYQMSNKCNLSTIVRWGKHLPRLDICIVVVKTLECSGPLKANCRIRNLKPTL